MLWRHLKQNPEQELSDPLWGTSSGIWSTPLLGFCSMPLVSRREDVGLSCVRTLIPQLPGHCHAPVLRAAWNLLICQLRLIDTLWDGLAQFTHPCSPGVSELNTQGS